MEDNLITEGNNEQVPLQTDRTPNQPLTQRSLDKDLMLPEISSKHGSTLSMQEQAI
jgi:hypothetical protein